MENQMVENSNNNSNATEIATIVAKLYASIGLGGNDDSSEYVKSELNKAILANADALKYTFDASGDRIERLVDAFFTAVAMLLSNAKIADENKATVFVVKDAEGEFKFAVSAECVNAAATSDEMKWSYTTIFSEEILKDLEGRKDVTKFFADDKVFQHIFDQASYDVGGFVFAHSSYALDACRIVVDSINQIRQHTLLALNTLEGFRSSIDDMKAMAKDLKDQGRIHEAAVVIVFTGYMLGVHTIALEVESYATYPDKVLPPDSNVVNLVENQINRCSNMQKASDLDLAIDYEQILHALEVLKGLVKADQPAPNPTALSDATVDLIRATLQASVQIINALFPESESESESEDYVPEDEEVAKPETASNE